MIWYGAGWRSSWVVGGRLLASMGVETPWLFSYAHLRGSALTDALRWPGPRFLDSGAFTVARGGGTIPVQDYIAFCSRYAGNFRVYAALDVVGDADATWRNFLTMRHAGLDPLPTWHLDSSIPALHRVIDASDYFAVGGMVGMPPRLRYALLRKAWDEIYTRKPSIRVHGFGLTRTADLLAFPWYSVDSSSALQASVFGRRNVVSSGRVVTENASGTGRACADRRLLDSVLTQHAIMDAVTEHWKQHTYIVGRGCTHNVRRRE